MRKQLGKAVDLNKKSKKENKGKQGKLEFFFKF